ncbi:MAG TPA: DUF4013 domain-containing protein [Methanoculleus thermophilus]|nr:DUF4013 domain-containing protein [Methanoculleus thermophilus]
MDYGTAISRSFEYTKDALVGKWMRWVILVVLSIVQGLTLSLVPLLNGYAVRVLAGKTPAPEVDGWGKLFIDGWKLNIIALIYMLPAIIIFAVFGGFAIISAAANEATGGDPTAAVLSLLGGSLLAALIAIILAFIALFAIMRFAHTDSLGEAFNFGAIFAHIGKLGWGTWIIAVIVLLIIALIYGFVVGLLSMIPLIGWLIVLFLNVAFTVFYARYLALVYEETSAPM